MNNLNYGVMAMSLFMRSLKIVLIFSFCFNLFPNEKKIKNKNIGISLGYLTGPAVSINIFFPIYMD